MEPTRDFVATESVNRVRATLVTRSITFEHVLVRLIGWITDGSLDDVVFVNCPGTLHRPDVKPGMVFVAGTVLMGTCKQEFFIQLFLLLLQCNSTS